MANYEQTGNWRVNTPLLKRQLAAAHAKDRERYTHEKAWFIKRVIGPNANA
jgi:GrpB-like predicted nucleotidyltransferase (UPF0157 family)